MYWIKHLRIVLAVVCAYVSACLCVGMQACLYNGCLCAWSKNLRYWLLVFCLNLARAPFVLVLLLCGPDFLGCEHPGFLSLISHWSPVMTEDCDFTWVLGLHSCPASRFYLLSISWPDKHSYKFFFCMYVFLHTYVSNQTASQYQVYWHRVKSTVADGIHFYSQIFRCSHHIFWI